MRSRRFLSAGLLLAAAACANAPAGTAAERGLAALRDGQPRTARVELLNAIKEHPNDPRLRILQAEAYLALREGVSAQAEIDRARKLGAPVSATGHLMAHALLLQEQYRRALNEAAKAGPDSAAYASWVRGLALSALGDNAGAAAALDYAVGAAPKDHRAWLAFARFRRTNGDFAGAIEAADKAVSLKPANVEAITLRGELTRSQYGLSAAIPWFDRALEIDPNDVTALLERAATFGDMGQASAMLADTRKVLSLVRTNPMAYFLQATLAARAGNFELAQSLYQRTGGTFDDQPAGMLLASAIDYQTGSVERAIVRLDRLVDLQPSNLKARKLLAAAQWRLGDASAAAGTLRPLADRPDADSYSLTLMGKALAKLGDPTRASIYLARAAQPQQRSLTALASGPVSVEDLALLRGAVRTRPGDQQAKIRLIGALLSNGLGGEALDLAVRVQADNPGVPDAHVLVGDARGLQGDFAGAAREYRRAANIAFTEPVAMRMVEALERSGQAPAAAQVLQLFLQQNPRSVPAQLLAANRYLQAGDWANAIRFYEGLRRRLGDRDAVMLNNLAWAYSQQGDFEAAIPLARKAWSLDRDNPATADTLGWLLLKSGKDRAGGIALLQRAARGAPTDAEIRRHLEAARRRG
ncbi:MAG TPA: tetratricopeptide repeat protein [Allosphingosinicella sp.]